MLVVVVEAHRGNGMGKGRRKTRGVADVSPKKSGYLIATFKH